MVPLKGKKKGQKIAKVNKQKKEKPAYRLDFFFVLLYYFFCSFTFFKFIAGLVSSPGHTLSLI